MLFRLKGFLTFYKVLLIIRWNYSFFPSISDLLLEIETEKKERLYKILPNKRKFQNLQTVPSVKVKVLFQKLSFTVNNTN